MDRIGYRRSESRPGYWKKGARFHSLQRYVKDRFGSRFRSQLKGAKSQSRSVSMNRAQGGFNSKQSMAILIAIY